MNKELSDIKQKLLNEGWVSHEPKIDYCKLFLQKRVKDSKFNKTLYFINIDYYIYPHPQNKDVISSFAYARLYTEQAKVFGIEIQVDPKEVELETFFAELYQKLNCIPDPHND